MAKWEYKFVYGNAQKVEAELNKLAVEGWEPVTMGSTMWNCIVLLKRPVA